MAEDPSWRAWRPRLLALCDELRAATRDVLLQAHGSGDLERIARPRSRGAGDWTYGLDLPGEERIAAWQTEVARDAPLSVMTEDAGWRHLGPGPKGDPIALDAFDHGGPRIAFDPVDGTRNLMADLRPAWTVVSFAPAGSGPPRLRDVCAGIVAELPETRARTRRVFHAERGGPCTLELSELESGELLSTTVLRADDDDRADHGYFPFFRYMADLRPAGAALEAAFFERLERLEGADVRNCYDDQYITSAGQLVMLALGVYRMVVDPRAFLAERRGRPTITTKPYDLAGAVVCAESAGCAITDAEGRALDFPIDTCTPVSFVGYANTVTQRRLEPHWLAVSAEARYWK